MLLYVDDSLDSLYQSVVRRNPAETEFHQAVLEVLGSLGPVLVKHPELREHKVIERLCEPERQIIFRVPWQDDRGTSTSTGASASSSTARSARTRAGCGSTNRSPERHQVPRLRAGVQERADGHADRRRQGRRRLRPEGPIRRRDHAVLPELHDRAVPPSGEYTDVPAGDIGVGIREIGYMFGQYKRITNRYESGVLTGKGLDWGGALVRREATGLRPGVLRAGDAEGARREFEGKTCVVSGTGNVAIYTIEKIQQLGGRVIACSDSTGLRGRRAGHRSRAC
jgi:glutamate dehydrogenase (NADP+)